MKVVEQSSDTFVVVLNPSELEAFLHEAEDPPNGMINNIASLINYLLTTEVYYFQLRYNL